jgi:glutathione peroxidase
MKTIACTLAAFAFISATGCSDSSQPAAMTAEGIEREAAESPEVPEAPAVTSDHGYVLDTTVESITGEPVDLNSYRGKVVLVVNTASQCGLTPQYEQLQELYEQHKDSGLVVLAFPSNDFNQERGSNEEIAEYCDARYGVTFPMFSKISIKGEQAHPLYASLNELSEEPSWNFTKYLIDRDGRFVERFDPRTSPTSEALTSRIEELLDRPQAG